MHHETRKDEGGRHHFVDEQFECWHTRKSSQGVKETGVTENQSCPLRIMLVTLLDEQMGADREMCSRTFYCVQALPK